MKTRRTPWPGGDKMAAGQTSGPLAGTASAPISRSGTSLTCPNCHGSNIEYDSAQGSSVCVSCGTVLEENVVVSEVTFAELSTGASVLQGQFISSERGKSTAPTIFGRRMDAGESREATIALGRRRIQEVAVAVGGLAGEHFIETAHRWYILALQHQFTRGRRAGNIVAACLYIVCRQERTPHMLLDFADVLQTSVYSLGGTFLRLVRLLNLEIPLIDPSFFVGRFAARLEFGERTQAVANTALRLVARMKRDWIQTGRRPAGVCAAGLIIAARVHGFRRTETEVVRVVRVCEATLRRRLDEFAQTPSSNLTPEEFEGLWLEHEQDPPAYTRNRIREATGAAPKTRKRVKMEEKEERNKKKKVDSGREEEEEEEEEHMPLTPPPTQARLGPIPEFIIKPYSAPEESTFSDLEDDEEVESALLEAEEVALKTELWTALNEDYLKAEAEKARVAALGTEAGEEGGSVPLKKRAPRAPRAPRAVKPEQPAESAAEAAKQTIAVKRLSKKINYEALDSLLNTR